MSEAEMLQSIKQDVAIIREVLLGNGDTGKSVVVRLTQIEDSVKNCQARNIEYLTNSKADARMDKRSKAMIACALITSVGAIIISLTT